MHQFNRLFRLAAVAAMTLATLGATSGTALAQSGSVGRHYDRGATCFINEFQVNAPQVYAFDATTAVDTQTVYWTSEVWRLDEATGEFVLVTGYGEWTATVVDDGTQSDYVIIGGGQTFTINQSGTYRAAIRYFWAGTAAVGNGETYEWVAEYYMTDWSWYLGTYLPAVDSCPFVI